MATWSDWWEGTKEEVQWLLRDLIVQFVGLASIGILHLVTRGLAIAEVDKELLEILAFLGRWFTAFTFAMIGVSGLSRTTRAAIRSIRGI